MRKISLYMMAAILVMTGCSEAVGNQEVKSKSVSEKEYGENWPFKEDNAVLKCYEDNGQMSPVVIINGVQYGLTGWADSMHGQNNVNALDSHIIKIKKYGYMMKVDIATIKRDAEELCKH